MTGVMLKEQYISYLRILQTFNSISFIMLFHTFNSISLIPSKCKGNYVIRDIPIFSQVWEASEVGYVGITSFEENAVVLQDHYTTMLKKGFRSPIKLRQTKLRKLIPGIRRIMMLKSVKLLWTYEIVS